jgi:hypothetical protein
MASMTAEPETPKWWGSMSVRSLGVFWAVIVTAEVCLRVSRHWRSYDMFDKSFAVFALLALAAFPCFAIGRERKSGRKVELLEAYLLVMLVVQLFR